MNGIVRGAVLGCLLAGTWRSPSYAQLDNPAEQPDGTARDAAASEEPGGPDTNDPATAAPQPQPAGSATVPPPPGSPSQAPTTQPGPPAKAAAGQPREPRPAPGYYTEPPRTSPSSRAQPEAEPGSYPAVYEPPPPPEPTHVAPAYAIWLGIRGGWLWPAGNLWGRCVTYYQGSCDRAVTVSTQTFVDDGLMLEVDAGVRLGRRYNLFVAWERAQLDGGGKRFPLDLDSDGEADLDMPRSERGDSDLWGLGARFSSNADQVGLLVEMLVGWRRMRAVWDKVPNGAPEVLAMNQAPFEVRFGLGADIRLTRTLSLSPMATLGAGVFREIQWVHSDDTRENAIPESEYRFQHSTFTLHLGAHFDLAGKG